MRIRLPIAPLAEPAPAIEPRTTRTPIGHAIGIADTADGSDARDFALQLAELLAVRQVPSALCLLAYGVRPSVEGAIQARVERAQVAWSAHAIDADGGADPAIDPPPARLLLLVGAPALGSFAPGLSLLLGAQRPLNQWPPFLRRERSSFHLELAGDGRAAAEPLAMRLLARGFLPGR